MKKTLIMALAIVAAFSMSSCKSTKKLSEAATVANPSSQYQEVSPIEYTNPKRTENTNTTQQRPVAQPGDRQESVKVVDSRDASLLKNYNVVVGAFGSKTNAENFKAKMASRGFNAFLVQNPQGLYRVVAAGFDSRQQAVEVRDNIRTTYANDDPGTCPAAWLLVPAM